MGSTGTQVERAGNSPLHLKSLDRPNTSYSSLEAIKPAVPTISAHFTTATWTTSYHLPSASEITIPGLTHPTASFPITTNPIASRRSTDLAFFATPSSVRPTEHAPFLDLDPFHALSSTSTTHASQGSHLSTTSIALIVFFGLASIPISILFFYLTRLARFRFRKDFRHNDEWSSSWAKRHRRGVSGSSWMSGWGGSSMRRSAASTTKTATSGSGDRRSLQRGQDGVWRLSNGSAAASKILPPPPVTHKSKGKNGLRPFLETLGLLRNGPGAVDLESHSLPQTPRTPHLGSPLALVEAEVGRAWARPRRDEDVPDRVILAPAKDVPGELVAQPAPVRLPQGMLAQRERGEGALGVVRGIASARRHSRKKSAKELTGADARGDMGMKSIPLDDDDNDGDADADAGSRPAQRLSVSLTRPQNGKSIRFSSVSIPAIEIVDAAATTDSTADDPYAGMASSPTTPITPTARASRRLSQAWRSFLGSTATDTTAVQQGGASSRWSSASQKSEKTVKRQSRGNRRYSMEEWRDTSGSRSPSPPPSAPHTSRRAAAREIAAANTAIPSMAQAPVKTKAKTSARGKTRATPTAADAETDEDAVESDGESASELLDAEREGLANLRLSSSPRRPTYVAIRKEEEQEREEGKDERASANESVDGSSAQYRLSRKMSSPLAALERKLSMAQGQALGLGLGLGLGSGQVSKEEGLRPEVGERADARTKTRTRDVEDVVGREGQE